MHHRTIRTIHFPDEAPYAGVRILAADSRRHLATSGADGVATVPLLEEGYRFQHDGDDLSAMDLEKVWNPEYDLPTPEPVWRPICSAPDHTHHDTVFILPHTG